jgi:hypothetical protein
VLQGNQGHIQKPCPVPSMITLPVIGQGFAGLDPATGLVTGHRCNVAICCKGHSFMLHLWQKLIQATPAGFEGYWCSGWACPAFADFRHASLHQICQSPRLLCSADVTNLWGEGGIHACPQRLALLRASWCLCVLCARCHVTFLVALTCVSDSGMSGLVCS